MVQQASQKESRAWSALPSGKEMALRKIVSVFLMAALLTVLFPFTPFQWLTNSPGPALLDQFLSPPAYLGALFFQWRIAGVVGNLLCNVGDMGFVYHHGMYWTLALGELVVCMGVGMAKNEVARRVSAVVLVGGSWGVGWFATPERYKQQGKDLVFWLWTMLAIDHARAAVGGGRQRRW
ncbi:hypothetical protein BJ875DRAFT_380974 [Amylocarpus encephaloides]|uniref:Uncharacterized protein n=1 Tax=Amylocarpus encephaloides TaxID=45428 RepID=A0A9P7YF86_9HELO|nr:hypothetical protein BJ875DRAFT_380974 [Amylocarpus encephaloides]